MVKPLVIKVGGNDLAQPDFIPSLAAFIANRQKTDRCILVHGGGRTIDALMEALGIEPVYVDGQRVTDEAVLSAAEMVLSGQVNKQLVLALLEAGLDAQGLSGVDRGLIRVEPWNESMGLVGRIMSVRAEVINSLLLENVVPVISPISLGPAGRYNVNADHAAGAIAGAVGAAEVLFLTNVSGVQVHGKPALQLTLAEVDQLIQEQVINGGMIPKVNAAREALSQGVEQALITNLAGLHAGISTAIVV